MILSYSIGKLRSHGRGSVSEFGVRTRCFVRLSSLNAPPHLLIGGDLRAPVLIFAQDFQSEISSTSGKDGRVVDLCS